MARSRLEKIGTIFSRTTGLLKSGAMKDEDKPLWYAIYKAFPPRDEPLYDRPESSIRVRKIFYPEDEIRAKYHNNHPNQPCINLNDTTYRTQTQLFIEKYESLKEDELTDSERYELAVSQVHSSKTDGQKNESSQESQKIPHKRTPPAATIPEALPAGSRTKNGCIINCTTRSENRCSRNSTTL